MTEIVFSLNDEAEPPADLFNPDVRIEAYAYDRPPAEFNKQTETWRPARVEPSSVMVWLDVPDRKG